MFTAAAILFLVLILGVVFLFIARRILRIAMKLAFAMAVIVLLVAGAGVGWWQGWFETSTKNRAPAGTTNKRPAGANRSSR